MDCRTNGPALCAVFQTVSPATTTSAVAAPKLGLDMQHAHTQPNGAYHYHAVARAANQRYLDALAVVDRPGATRRQLDRACEPVRFRQRRRRGLNLLRDEEQQLFRAVLQGQHRLHGFRNADIARYLDPALRDPACQRRRTACISRQLQLLRAHGLIAKIPHSYRYRVTAHGEALMSSAIYLRYKSFPLELANAA